MEEEKSEIPRRKSSIRRGGLGLGMDRKLSNDSTTVLPELPVPNDNNHINSIDNLVLKGIGQTAVATAGIQENRSRRRREEAVRRLVSDVERIASSTAAHNAENIDHGDGPSNVTTNVRASSMSRNEEEELLLASTVASAIERGLDREFHNELTKRMKESAGVISRICHDHSDAFLGSVAKVVALGTPCQEIRNDIEAANRELQTNTGGSMLVAANELEYAKHADARARTMKGIIAACRRVAVLLERARKQASLTRPREALDAVDEARTCLTAPVSSLLGIGIHINARGNNHTSAIQGRGGQTHPSDNQIDMDHHRIYDSIITMETERLGFRTSLARNNSGTAKPDSSEKSSNDTDANDISNHDDDNNGTDKNGITTPKSQNKNKHSNTSTATSSHILSLDETPFGARAMRMLPKIENEVLMGARRGLNRWFLSIRSGGDGAKAGRAAMRMVSSSMVIGPGQLGLGGKVQAFAWRAKNADNLISRVKQSGRVARAARMGYWLERDLKQDLERLEGICPPGMERRAEAFASAFGWYRCWHENASLDIEAGNASDGGTIGGSSHGMGRSGHGLLNRSGHGRSDGGSLNRSGHGLNSSGHGMPSSRIGRSSSLGFRAAGTNSRDLSIGRKTRTGRDGKRQHTQWAIVLTPTVLFEDSETRKDDEEKLSMLPESVHPVRRAEAAFALLGKTSEFRQYYEQNRFGDMKIKEKTMNGEDAKEKETRSSLSSLTGDDVGQGTDRIFFSRSLSQFCASIVGFSAVEAALEIGNFQDEDENNSGDSKGNLPVDGNTIISSNINQSTQNRSSLSFRESSEKYERSLIAELGSLLRNRAIGATLAELARASCLMASFRSAMKIVHPSSGTRRTDKELLAMDVDILMIGLKVAQEEQLNTTARIVKEDSMNALRVHNIQSRTSRGGIGGTSSRFGSRNTFGQNFQSSNNITNKPNIPAEEVVDFPFGLSDLKQSKVSGNSMDGLEGQTSRPRSIRHIESMETEYFTFSQSVQLIIKSIHARAIAFASFALSQQELGQVFDFKKGGGVAGYVLDCVEECVKVAAVGVKDGYENLDDLRVSEAVQITANIYALQSSLPRLFGVLMRGLCHTGMIQTDQLDEIFRYADSSLERADKACDQEVVSMYNLVYELSRNKIDSMMQISLENFQWVARTPREIPNTYCETLIGYLRTLFKSLGPMNEGSKAGLHFSCCGHIAERLLDILIGNPTKENSGEKDDGNEYDGGNSNTLPIIAKIDAYGLKNLSLDIEEFESFADSTGVPQLSECFNELKCLTLSLLDRDLPMLLQPENEHVRRRKYPLLSLEKICKILEKYHGTGLGDKLMRSSGKGGDILMLERKEVSSLVKLLKTQILVFDS